MNYSVRNKSPTPWAKITSNPKNDCQFFLKFLNHRLNEHLISTVLDEDFMSFSWKDNEGSHQTSLSLVLFRMRFTIKTCLIRHWNQHWNFRLRIDTLRANSHNWIIKIKKNPERIQSETIPWLNILEKIYLVTLQPPEISPHLVHSDCNTKHLPSMFLRSTTGKISA